jgi:hypothetical protein
MTWLYLPPGALPEPEICSASRSVPAQAGSTSGSPSPCPDIELWAMSNGKPTPRPFSWHGWKRRPWIRHLSGTTLEPSTAAGGAARWTSSLRAIRVSRSPSRANAGARTTHAIFGRMSPASSERSSHPSCSSRMSPIISASDFPKSPEDWSAWATALRRASSRRRKSVRPTSARGSSSLPIGKATNWPTPRACSGTRSSGGNRTELLRLWPTPRASANENRQTKPTPSQEAGKHGMNLATSAAMWPTPQTDSFRSRGGARKHEKGLDGMARDWPTPMATDGNKPSAGNRKSADLTSASRMWMTPTARDHKDGATSLANTPVNGLLGRQVLVTPMAGSDTSKPRRTLNPLFVEALMGWPTGWTGFASVATAWSHWLPRMRSELLQLNCWPMDEVVA